MLDELFLMPVRTVVTRKVLSAPRPSRVTLGSAPPPVTHVEQLGPGPGAGRPGGKRLRVDVGPGLELPCAEPSPPALFAFSFPGNVHLTLSSPWAPS